jgi:GNAT superfamily N-acetyltransferase
MLAGGTRIMADVVELEQLESRDGETFRELYAIYAASIVAREQKPEGWIAAMVGAPEYRVWVAKVGGVVRGFSIVFQSAAESFALLEYMAVASEVRNQGLGRELFLRSVAFAVTPQGRKLPVLLEIDSDREASSDRAMRTRREQFYRRLGCLRIAGLRYLMPLPGEGSSPEMDLMVYAAQPFSSLGKGELERWLESIYRDVYHCSPDDPRIGQMLADLPDPLRVE